MNGTEESVSTSIACNICGGKDTKPVFSLQDRQLVRCCNCGLVYTNPWKADAPLYQDESYFTGQNRYIARRHEFEHIFDDILSQVETYRQKGRLLDIGCGQGLLLDVARQRGWDVFGLEISEWAAKYAREELKLPVACGNVEEQPFPDGHFDVIIANHSLEHMPDPSTALGVMHRMLASNGMLVIGVPNFASLMAALRRSRWASLVPAEHRWHFTPKTLRLLLEKSGFRTVSIRYVNHNYWAHQAYLVKRLAAVGINWLSLKLNRGEAMLVFAIKEQSHR
jgi:SAM-dependent methyltransferase